MTEPTFPGLLGPAARSALHLCQSPFAARALARVTFGSLLVLLVLLMLVPWQQNIRGGGRVVAYAPLDRQQNIEAPIEGRVRHWHVREGSKVAQGDPVVEIIDNDPALLARLEEERDAVKARLVAAQARVRAVEGRVTELGGSRSAGLSAAESRTRMAQDRVRAAEQAQAAAQAARQTARLNQERQQLLHRQGLSSTRTLELAELDALRTTTEAERAEAALRAARSEEAALRADKVRVGTDVSAAMNDARAALEASNAEVAAARAELARIEVRLARQTTQKVLAPRAGVILRLVGGQGSEMVKAGDALAILVPDTDERAAELWVDGNDVPLLTEGRHVRLQFEGWPAVQFSGWPSVAVGTFGGKVVLIDATDDGKGRFRVLVTPDGDDPWPSGRYLRQGVRVTGWVLLNRVRLGYELWRQFNGFPPTVAMAEPDGDGLYAKPDAKGGKKDGK